jgi:hypothetical protein
MILNDKQKQELLKLLENQVNVLKDLNINPTDLMPEVERAFVNFEAYHRLNRDVKKELKFDIKNYFKDCIDPEHFIYYEDAMDYLREEDSSLRQSFEIAKKYDLQDICSTTLANLLYNQEQNDLIDRIDFDYIIETIIKNQ